MYRLTPGDIKVTLYNTRTTYLINYIMCTPFFTKRKK